LGSHIIPGTHSIPLGPGHTNIRANLKNVRRVIIGLILILISKRIFIVLFSDDFGF